MNVLELAKWRRIILKEGELDGKQVLNKESVQETMKPHSIMETLERRPEFAYTTGYGYGWYLDAYKGHNVIHHGGSNPGYRSSLHLFPDDDLVVATLANIMVTDIPTNLAWYIADGIFGLPKTEDWIYEFTAKRTQRTYDSYARIFKNDIPDRIKDTHHVHKLPAYASEYTHPVYGKITVILQED
ncbi:hypothetical protein BGX29_004388, partial [Mortierella sp. GBA35]